MRNLEDLLDVDPSGPEVQRARALVEEDRRFLRSLVARRKELGLSQQGIANLLGVKQPTIASFERYDSDPKLSTVRRYAHALQTLVCHYAVADTGQAMAGAWPPAEGWTTIRASLSPTVFSSTGDTDEQEPSAAPARGALSLAA